MMLAFDEEKHEYTLAGRVIPSVTQLLKDAGVLQFGVGELANEAAMMRGKAVHAACHYLDEGDLNWKSVSDEIIGFVFAYEKFKEETGFKPDRIEERLFHPSLMYAGTLDREGTWKLSKNRVLIDLKTGQDQPGYALQLAGYDLLLPTLTLPRERFGVELYADGSFKLIDHNEESDRDIFLSIVSLWWWKQNHGIKGRTV